MEVKSVSFTGKPPKTNTKTLKQTISNFDKAMADILSHSDKDALHLSHKQPVQTSQAQNEKFLQNAKNFFASCLNLFE